MKTKSHAAAAKVQHGIVLVPRLLENRPLGLPAHDAPGARK